MGPSFVHWLANRVISLLGFPNGLVGRVWNFTSSCFPHGLADRVGPLLGFPHRLADRVANIASPCFPYRLADRVGPLLGFPHRLSDSVANFFLSLLTHITRDVDDPVFTDAVVNRTAAGFALAFPPYAANCLHNGVALPLVAARRTAVVTRRSTVARLCCRRQQRQGEDCESLHYGLSAHRCSPSQLFSGDIGSLVKTGGPHPYNISTHASFLP